MKENFILSLTEREDIEVLVFKKEVHLIRLKFYLITNELFRINIMF